MKVLEVAVALAVGFLVIVTGWGLLARGAEASRALLARNDLLEVQRVTTWVLERELAGARPGLDWSPHPDGLAVRAFRGWGLACAVADGGASGSNSELPGVVIDYRGLRQPDPAKDSLQLTAADGRRRVVDLADIAGREPTDVGCPPDSRALHLRWNGDDVDPVAPPRAVVLVRVFERGLYAVDDAFRYRRGAGGRQPLTNAVLDADGSWLGVRDGVPALELAGARVPTAPRSRTFRP
jgi:hypothetical protein